MHYFLYGIASSELAVALHYILCRASNRGWESGCLLPKAICLNNTVETQLRIMFNMNEKLEPFEKADGGFSRIFPEPAFFHVSLSHQPSFLLLAGKAHTGC